MHRANDAPRLTLLDQVEGEADNKASPFPFPAESQNDEWHRSTPEVGPIVALGYLARSGVMRLS